jgi:hypothetical protein
MTITAWISGRLQAAIRLPKKASIIMSALTADACSQYQSVDRMNTSIQTSIDGG